METTATTARDQFVSDYLLIVDNDQEAYNYALEIAREADGSVAKASDRLREEFESYISEVSDRERKRGNKTGADLISQLLIGFGSSTFDDIARSYIDLDLETRLYDRLTSVLKTGE